MDVDAALNELGVDKTAARVIGLLPLVYVAWADGKIQRAERESIRRAAEKMGWLEGGGADVLERWLTTRPTDEQLKTGVALLNHLAKDKEYDRLGADDLRMLLLLCQDVADSAGSFLGIGRARSDEEIAALESIALSLDIKNAKGWRALQDTR
jgi:hypothetical protein